MNNKKWTRTVFASAITIALAGCGGSSGSDDPAPVDNDPVIVAQKQLPKPGQAILGPIIGATVTIRDIADIDTIACTATTTDSADVASAGGFSFDQPCVFADNLYLVTVAGGNDIDYADDGARDMLQTPNSGEFRALLSGEQLLQDNWKVSALTEATYQAVQYALQNSTDDIIAIVDEAAQQLLAHDINADGIIDRFDTAQWHPVANALAVANLDRLRSSSQLIHQNLNRTLAQIPDADSLAIRIDTLAPARQVLAYNDALLVATDTALLVYRIQGGEAILLSSLATGWIYDMTLAQDAVYVALGDEGIARIDLADPSRLAISERWPYPTQQIVSLGEQVVFSVKTVTTLRLMTIDSNGAQQPVLESYWNKSDPLPVLKKINDVVYWAPASNVKRLILQDDSWREIAALELEFELVSLGVSDVEVANNQAYVVAATTFLNGLPHNGGKWVTENLAMTYDVSDRDNPAYLNAFSASDFTALYQINGKLAAIGDHTLSLRDPATFEVTASPLPQNFNSFNPTRGAAAINGFLAIAASENGVLLLSTDAM